MAALMLLPILYIGSYFAMVTPAETITSLWHFDRSDYRFGHEYARRIYWPLEQADRKIRPKKWEWYPAIIDSFPIEAGKPEVSAEPEPKVESQDDDNG